jgi:hypothetical protein
LTARGSKGVCIWFGWIRPRTGEKTGPWLVIKPDDEFGDVGDPEIIGEEATSRLTGHANEELAAAGVVRKDHAARARGGESAKNCPSGHHQTSGRSNGIAVGIP